MIVSESIEELAPAAPAPVRPRRGTLLIVDDEEGPRESLRVIFKDEYEVLLAVDGRSAIELAQAHKIHVAVIDVRMAGMSGIEVLERLKYVDPTIEAVMMTAFETADTMRQALRLRACDYLNKPFDISTMRAAVANAMQRRTLESELTTNSEEQQKLLQELQDQKLRERMSQTRGDIYASIIHDINGPLTVISGYIHMLNQRIGAASRLEADDLEFVKGRLKTITRQVTNCIGISRRYLSFLRQPSNDGTRVGFNQILSDLGQLIRVHPSMQQNELSLEPLHEDVSLRMNGTDLIQILLNLVVNAFQCTSKPHKVVVAARVSPDPLDLRQFKDGPQDRLLNLESFHNAAPLLTVSVEDDGPGIPPETLPKIFEPYFTTKAAKQGTGLGLNIVQRLIREAKGLLLVHTEPGQGTRFTVYLAALSLRTPEAS